jgi:exopolysaccharide biosynthesis protein
MKRALFLCALLSLATVALADWKPVADGVAYRRFNEESIDIHVTRVDLTNAGVRVIASRESDRGTRVSEFAKKSGAIVAINADYFDDHFNPIGLAIGPCGAWSGTKDTTREGVVAIGDGHAVVYPQKEILAAPEPWMNTAVSGWPMLVRSCTPLTAAQLPGSDGFTRTPHPRTAVGVSKDGTTLYLVVADGRREGVPGLTLAKLARFMADELGACSAMNLDGGGSSAMWVDGAIVNHPADKVEREVAVHLAVVRADDVPSCEEVHSAKSSAAGSQSQ